jgi:hypothetical protein
MKEPSIGEFAVPDMNPSIQTLHVVQLLCFPIFRKVTLLYLFSLLP